MSNRRHFEQSRSSNPADAQSDILRGEAIRLANTHWETSPEERERLDKAAKSLTEDPEVILEQLCPRRGNKQDELQASISHYRKKASTAEKKGDDEAYREATNTIWEEQKKLSYIRHALYDSEEDKPPEDRDRKLLDASKKAYSLGKELGKIIEKIKIQVNEEMLTSEHSTRLTEAKTKREEILIQAELILGNDPINPQELIQITQKFKDADNKLKLAQEDYDTASTEKTNHSRHEAQKEFKKAIDELYNNENRLYKKLEKNNLKDKMYARLEAYGRHNMQEQYIKDCINDNNNIARALLRKYPDVQGNLQEITIRDQSGDQSDSTALKEKRREIDVDIDMIATKRKQLEWLSSQKWREMREKQLWPKVSEDSE